MNRIEAAHFIAYLAHGKQKSRNGMLYFTEHVKHVACQFLLGEDKVVAYLHDVVEDTKVTIE